MHTHPHNTRLAFVIAVLLSLAAWPPAHAAPISIILDIPAQPLSDALSALSLQSGTPLLYEGDLAKNIRSPALQGAYTAEAALDKLFAGTGLDYRRTEKGAIVVAKEESRPERQPAKESENAAPALATVKVTSQAGYDAADPYNKDYAVPNAFSATKTDTPIMDTPVSIQVVPRSVMDDQKTTRIKDALENVSGVRYQPSLGAGSGFIIRGFRDTRVYRNGLLANFAAAFPAEFDAGNLQSIEVLKGPAAVLYGRIEPGGLINITTKKPFDIPYYSLEQQFGSYDFYRSQWDATGAVTDDKSLQYRFTGAYQNNNSFRDFVFTDRVLVNP
ncbi:MAG: TonB-dependent siderophore receptor, partial [Methylococcales bacterium]